WTSVVVLWTARRATLFRVLGEPRGSALYGFFERGVARPIASLAKAGRMSARKEIALMKLRTQLALPLLVMVVGFGVFVSAQAKKAATPAKAKRVRVFFIEPKNNATLSSPVHMKFGSEGIEISPVPPGDPKDTRPGVAHYHVGI